MNDKPENEPEDAPEDVVVIDVTPDSDDAPEEKPARKRRAPALIVGLLLIVAIFAGGVYFAPRIADYIPGLERKQASPSVAAAPSNDLSNEIAALNDRISMLEQKPAPPAPTPAGDVDLSPLQGQLDRAAQELQQARSLMEDMSRRIAQLEARPVASTTPGVDPQVVAALRNEVASLRQQLANIQTAPKTSPDVLEPLTVVALSRLRQAVELGQGYAPALKGVEQLLVARGTISAAAGAALGTLEKTAANGVPTFAALNEDFTAIASDIVANEKTPDDPSWWDRTVSTVSSAVTVRSTGNLEGNSTEARVARAEVALKATDLGTAVGEIDGVTGGGARVAKDWLAAARSRLAALQALDTLEAELLEGL